MAGKSIEEVVEEKESTEGKPPRLKPSEFHRAADRAAKEADDEDREAGYKTYDERKKRRSPLQDHKRSP